MESAAAKARRLAAEQQQRVLKQQWRDKLEVDYLGDILMDQRERTFMKPELAVAKSTVIMPHRIALNKP